MFRRAATAALLLQCALRAVPQSPEATQEPIVLKSASHAVQLDVFVTDPTGQPVHGLRKSDFVVADNGHPRDIRIFAGEIETSQPASSATEPPPGMYSNRFGMRDSRIVTAIVIDAAPRPEGLQKNAGRFASARPDFWFGSVHAQAMRAIQHMQPGQTMAIYAACPDLRIVQDFTSDPGRLAASLNAFVPPPLPKVPRKQQPNTIDTLVPPLLSALRDAASRVSGASGSKSIVWISQAYGTELNVSAISEATDMTVAAFNDARIPLYAVDARFSPTCDPPNFSRDENGRIDRPQVVSLNCSQPPDVSDEWMQYLADATGGRLFSGGEIVAVEARQPPDPMGGSIGWGMSRVPDEDGGLIGDALRFAVDNSRYAYVMGFYVPESDMDGKVHKLSVTLPAKPKFELRYRSGYTASAAATALAAQEAPGPGSRSDPASPRNPDEVGIDAKIDRVGKNELRISLGFAPETVTRTADGVAVLDATFTQTDDSGKQRAKVQDVVRVPAPETPTGLAPYSRTLKLANGAVLLHIEIRDPATNRLGTLAVPIPNR